jgi:hypothetical protein
VVCEETLILDSVLLTVQPGTDSSATMVRLDATRTLPDSAHAASICSGVAGVSALRKRETGSVVAVGKAIAKPVTVTVGSVRLPVGSAAPVVKHVEGPTGIVSMMVVVMIETLVRTENAVAVGQASEMVLLIRSVELLVGNKGTVLFSDALGVADGIVRFPMGNAAEEVISKDVLGVGRIVEMFPTEKEDTVE